SSPADLDIAASRTGNKVFLHIASMNYSQGTEARFAVEGMAVTGGRVLEISPESPRQEISPLNPDVFKPVERALIGGDEARHRFPPRSVSVVELDCHAA